jgi:hypothetical protein
MDKGSTRPTSEDPGARETGSLLRTLEETSGGNTERVQTLRKKITLSSSDRRRRGEVESAHLFTSPSNRWVGVSHHRRRLSCKPFHCEKFLAIRSSLLPIAHVIREFILSVSSLSHGSTQILSHDSPLHWPDCTLSHHAIRRWFR